MRGPRAFFTFCLRQGCADTRAPGDLPTMLCASCRTSEAGFSRRLCMCKCMGLPWPQSCASTEYVDFSLIFFLCQHQSNSIQPQPYAGLCDVSAEYRRLLPTANIETAKRVRVESLFSGPCQDIPLDLFLNPDAFFFFFLLHSFESINFF